MNAPNESVPISGKNEKLNFLFECMYEFMFLITERIDDTLSFVLGMKRRTKRAACFSLHRNARKRRETK